MPRILYHYANLPKYGVMTLLNPDAYRYNLNLYGCS